MIVMVSSNDCNGNFLMIVKGSLNDCNGIFK